MEAVVGTLPQTPRACMLLGIRIGASGNTIVITHNNDMIIAGLNTSIGNYYITIGSRTTTYPTIELMQGSLQNIYADRYCRLEESILAEIHRAKSPTDYSTVSQYYEQIRVSAPYLCSITRFKFFSDWQYIYANPLIAPWIDIRFKFSAEQLIECVDYKILSLLESRARDICALVQ